MPKGPQGQKRPGDVIGTAVMVARIATGEVEDEKSNAAAVLLGKKGGAARAASLSKKKRSQIAKKAAAKRWKNKQ